MAKCAIYYELNFRDSIISMFSEDTWIKSQIEDLNSVANIQGLSLLEFIVNKYPAISVELMSKEIIKYLQERDDSGQLMMLTEEMMIPYRVDVACQHENRETAYRNSFKLAKDCKITAENNRNLNFQCDYLFVSSIENTGYGQNPLWTYIYTFYIIVINYVSLFADAVVTFADSPNQVIDFTPEADGIETVFTLDSSPLSGSDQVFDRGMFWANNSNVDYTISGNVLTCISAPAELKVMGSVVAPKIRDGNPNIRVGFTPASDGIETNFVLDHEIDPLSEQLWDGGFFFANNYGTDYTLNGVNLEFTDPPNDLTIFGCEADPYNKRTTFTPASDGIETVFILDNTPLQDDTAQIFDSGVPWVNKDNLDYVISGNILTCSQAPTDLTVFIFY